MWCLPQKVMVTFMLSWTAVVYSDTDLDLILITVTQKRNPREALFASRGFLYILTPKLNPNPNRKPDLFVRRNCHGTPLNVDTV
jgi:hypothetical protein